MKLLRYPVVQTVMAAVLWLAPLSAIGQDEAALESVQNQSNDQLLESEFELLQMPMIESASKRSESVFDSPLSADVITREMIQRSGARTIPEALRLLPGMLVYEQSAGNFDVHIRGFDNIQPGSMLQDFISSTVLVMIDYRVVYNYLQGGTFWEALPVDIVDVERIELVRGPVAALYGPNAVTGVINIITRKYTTDGLHINADAKGALSTGDPKWKKDFTVGQRSVSGRVGYKYHAFSGGLSANYHSYDKYDKRIFSYYSETPVYPPRDIRATANYGVRDPLGDRAKAIYPEPELGYRTVGANCFAGYEPSEKLSVALNCGYQESRTLREYVDQNFSPFATHESQTWYLDLRSRFYNFTFQASFLSGHQKVPGITIDVPDGTTRERYEYNFNTLDLNLEYDFAWEWLRVRPGVSFRRARYSGYLFSEWEGDQETGDAQVLQSAAVSVGLEQALWKLRFIEAVRLDIYFDRTEDHYYPIASSESEPKHGKKVYPSFEFAVTYAPADDHLVRVSYARASKSPSILDSYYSGAPLPYGSVFVTTLGNKAVDLVTFDTVELGYRTHFTKNTDISLDVFGTYARDFSNAFYRTLTFDDPRLILVFQYDNLDLQVRQVGTTVSFGYTTQRLQGRIFATVQRTWIDNNARDLVRKMFDAVDLDYSPLKSEYQTDSEHVGTPDFFGGFYLNYQPADRWNINVNAYFFSQRTQIHYNVRTNNEAYPVGHLLNGEVPIQQSFLLNAKVSYNFWMGFSVYASIRNLFNINQPQFIWGDPNHVLCFIGLQYDL